MIAACRRGILGRLRGIQQTSSQDLRALPGPNSFLQVPFPRLGPATTFWWGISLEPASPGRAWPLRGHAGRVAERSAADSAIAGEDRVALAPHPASDTGPATRQPPSTVEWLRFQRVF